ncbi:YcxB family protein [Streptomyces sp. ISL-99]|uniref:YcxB family protein n=1 Tax=Streptomyces sp. ISL-99 TaxID=2819193 RepID=UPI001BE81C52|nr:YcxB family protein [Streptomyces sp. ISL-99]MBT2527054.1 YcxB family protein [Streptomyces sp. ISL-99]
MDHQGRDLIQAAETVELTYRPTRGDILAGIRVRDRVRHFHVLRGAVMALFAGFGLLLVVAPGGPPAGNVLLCGLVVLFVWSVPHLQAHHVLRIVKWQGEYRATVTDAGVSATNEHATLTTRWSLFRGYRETRDHVVLLSRDPNILCLEVLPKRGLGAPDDIDRLRAILDRNLRRV